MSLSTVRTRPSKCPSFVLIQHWKVIRLHGLSEAWGKGKRMTSYMIDRNRGGQSGPLLMSIMHPFCPVKFVGYVGGDHL